MTVQLELPTVKRQWIEDGMEALPHLTQGLPDLWSTDDLHPIMPRPEHPNWWGCLLSAAKNAGLIERAGYQPSQRPEANGRVVAVWRRRV